MIPRLPPATTELTVSITVNEKLRPYFTEWYQRRKIDGETPTNFALRILKQAAMADYAAENLQQAQLDAIQTLQDDVEALGVEVD